MHFVPPGDILPAGYCHACGYDLRGTPGQRCPECNTDRQQSSTALLERAAVWSTMDLPRWGSRAAAMARMMAWPPAALRLEAPPPRWRRPVRRVLVWVIAGYLLVELFSYVRTIGLIIGLSDQIGWMGWQEGVLTVPKFMLFECLLWLTVVGTIGWLYCRECELRTWTTWTQLTVLILVAFPFCQAIRTVAVFLPVSKSAALWRVINLSVYVVLGAYIFLLTSRILGHRSRSNLVRFLVVAILTLTWWFETDLWLMFYRMTLWIRSFTGPEVY